MTIRTKLAALAGATALAVTGMTGVQVASAPPAAAASCTIDAPLAWSVFNRSCLNAQHFNILKGNVYKYAPLASRGKTSKQPVCWANMITYGARVWV